MQQKKDNTGFNIRKVYKKNMSISKNPEEIGVYSPQIEFEKSYQPLTYTSILSHKQDTKKQKELILDQTVNEAILNSKTYIDLKKAYQQNKRKNNQRLDQLNNQVTVLKNQKAELLNEKQKINSEKKKILEAIEQMKGKLQKLKEQNDQKRDNAQNYYENEAEYFNQLLLSMRFHAEYQHNIDPDQMTYEQLLELEEKIGNVSKGLPEEVIEAMEKFKVQQDLIQNEEKCAVCYCNFELQELITSLNPCKHQFHFDCLKTWLLKEKVCPLCKTEIQIHRKQPINAQQEQQNFNQNEANPAQQISQQV